MMASGFPSLEPAFTARLYPAEGFQVGKSTVNPFPEVDIYSLSGNVSDGGSLNIVVSFTLRVPSPKMDYKLTGLISLADCLWHSNQRAWI